MWAVFKRRVAEPLPWPRPLLALLSGLCSRNYWTARPEARTAHGPANTHSEEEAAPRHTPPPAGSWGGNIPVPLRRFHITWVLFASHSDPEAQSGVFPVQRGDWGSD